MPGFEQAGGLGAPAPSSWPSRAGDAAKAAEYMKAAGFASGRYEGEPILMVGPVDGNGREISEIAKQAFEAAGFEVKLRLLFAAGRDDALLRLPEGGRRRVPEHGLDA